MNRRHAIWRGAICLLLAALFLYNPFANMAAAANGLAIAHRESNRSTVGSAELQHFTSAPSQETCTIEVATVASFRADLAVIAVFPIRHEEARIRPQMATVPSLWFRPPPIRLS